MSDLDEYVLNNKGRIWVGSAKSNYGRPWQFAQFNTDSLQVSLWLLNKMPYTDRGDPIKVFGKPPHSVLQTPILKHQNITTQYEYIDPECVSLLDCSPHLSMA